MSIQTIVVAALALLILIVLILIFTGKMGDFVGVTNSCEELGNPGEYQCVSGTSPGDCPSDTIFYGRGCADNSVCCKSKDLGNAFG